MCRLLNSARGWRTAGIVAHAVEAKNQARQAAPILQTTGRRRAYRCIGGTRTERA